MIVTANSFMAYSLLPGTLGIQIALTAVGLFMVIYFEAEVSE
jgi:hypothetical protein